MFKEIAYLFVSLGTAICLAHPSFESWHCFRQPPFSSSQGGILVSMACPVRARSSHFLVPIPKVAPDAHSHDAKCSSLSSSRSYSGNRLDITYGLCAADQHSARHMAQDVDPVWRPYLLDQFGRKLGPQDVRAEKYQGYFHRAVRDMARRWDTGKVGNTRAWSTRCLLDQRRRMSPCASYDPTELHA